MNSKTKRKIGAIMNCAAFFLVNLTPMGAFAESLTMTTWYPAPVGVYQSLITTGGAPSSPVNTILNRDAGRVGIGTTSPNAPLSIQADPGGLAAGLSFFGRPTADDSQIYFFKHDQATLNGFMYSSPSQMQLGTSYAAPLKFTTESSEKMRIDASGNVGIGTTSPQTKLHVVHPSGPGLTLQPAALDQGGYSITYLQFMKPSGEILGSIGYQAGDNKLSLAQANGDVQIMPSRGNRVIMPHYYTSASQSLCAEGGYNSNSAFAIGECSSSRAMKEDIKPLSVDKGKVFQLQPVSFKWKKNRNPDVGLIAEDVAQTLPELVDFRDGKATGVEYKLLSLYLLDIVKSHESEIGAIEKENAELKKRLSELEARTSK